MSALGTQRNKKKHQGDENFIPSFPRAICRARRQSTSYV
jgi:hypothetical protein